MAAAAILKNKKVATTLQRIDKLWWNLVCWRISALWATLANKIWEFLKSKMAAAAILKNKKSWYLINHLTNFDKIWHVDALCRPGPLS